MKIQYVLELLGTAFFAVSGALVANKKNNPDWLGVSFIGFITSIGGGSLRDMMLGSFPLAWIKDVNYLYAIFIGVIVTSIFYNMFLKMRKAFFIFDTLGIAMFTILGAEKSLSLNLSPIVAVIMGMFSAVMGGVIRDLLTNEIPVLFQKTIYASACLAGASLYVILDNYEINRTTNIWVSMLLIIAIRILAVKYNLSIPQFRKGTR